MYFVAILEMCPDCFLHFDKPENRPQATDLDNYRLGMAVDGHVKETSFFLANSRSPGPESSMQDHARLLKHSPLVIVAAADTQKILHLHDAGRKKIKRT